MKLLSIVIPSFNMEDYLPRNLGKLTSINGINDIEIIVVNDGSKDQTLEIAREFEAKCQSVKVIDKPNGHYGSCLNAALEVATGKYFRILDADDWFESEALDEFIDKVKNSDADLLVTLRKEWTMKSDGSWHVDQYPIEGIKYDHIYDAAHTRFTDYSKKVEFNMHSMTYKTEVLKRVGLKLPHGVCYTDLIYCLVPLDSIKDFIVFDIYLYNYFVGREGSSSNNDSIKKNLSHILKVLHMMLTYIDGHPASTPEVMDNQLRFVKEASSIMLSSLERNTTVSPELYNSYIEPIRKMLRGYDIMTKKLRKFYFHDWYTNGGYIRLLFWMKVNFVTHPKYW